MIRSLIKKSNLKRKHVVVENKSDYRNGKLDFKFAEQRPDYQWNDIIDMKK